MLEEVEKRNNEERSPVGYASPHQPYRSPTYGFASPAGAGLYRRGELDFDNNQKLAILIYLIARRRRGRRRQEQ